MPTENVILAKINAEISRIRALAENGWEWSEIGQAVQGFIVFVVDLLRSVNLDVEHKKEMAMQAIEALFDRLAPLIPLPFWLSFFRGTITGLLKTIVLQLADGAIERIYSHLKLSPIPEPEI